MSSLYSHNHYNEQGRCANLCARCPSLRLPTTTTKIILTAYFAVLFALTSWCIFFVDYVESFNLKYFQVYFVLFFTLIFVVVLLSWARQHYGDGHSIIIPMWFLGVANLIICFSGFFALFSFSWSAATKSLLFAWLIAFFNQLTLIIIAIYTIYRAFFTTPTSQTFSNSTHRQYALAATAEMDDSDVELELDLYTTSDQYNPHPANSSIYSNESISAQRSTQGLGNPGYVQKTGMSPIPQPNFDMNLNDEYTDVE